MFNPFIFAITRPLVIPLSVGGIGVWYGSYDFAYYISFGLTYPFKSNQLLNKKSFYYRSFNYIISLSSGIAVLAVRYKYAPESASMKSISWKSLSLENLKQLNFKGLPTNYIKYYFISIIMSGAITGSIQGISA